MRFYGNDKPDTRFEMKFVELKNAEKKPPTGCSNAGYCVGL